MQTLARRLKFYVLLVVACAAFLAACELGLRWMLPDDVPSTADYEMLEADDVLGYRLGPSIDAVFERTPANGGDRIRWRTNARGFRCDEYDPHRRVRRFQCAGGFLHGARSWSELGALLFGF